MTKYNRYACSQYIHTWTSLDKSCQTFSFNGKWIHSKKVGRPVGQRLQERSSDLMANGRPGLWKESRGFQRCGEVELQTMIESSCSKQAGDIRWSWMMKFRMRLVISGMQSQGPKLTDSSWPYIEKSLQKQWVFISSSKMTWCFP